MPVEIIEFAKIQDLGGIEREGKVTATNLAEIEDEDGVKHYGSPTGLAKIRTKIVCDLGELCAKGSIDGEFKTHPKVIEFDDQGQGPGQFIKDVAEVVIASDYKGQKLVFCSYECSTKYFRKLSKNSNVIEFPAGKGVRTFETGSQTGSKVLDDKSEGSKSE